MILIFLLCNQLFFFFPICHINLFKNIIQQSYIWDILFSLFYLTQFLFQQYNFMHNYNIANRYNTVTRVGNWYEQKELDSHQFKEYLYQKDNCSNLTLNTTAKLTFSNKQIQLTKKEGSQLNFGDVVQLESVYTEGVLAYNVNEPILGQETYAVTSSQQKKPALRNTFTIELVGDSPSSTVLFGDKIRITTVVNGRKLYLQSLPVSPMRSSKFSRQQEVSVTAALSSSSIWVVEKVNAKQRFDSVGHQVSILETVLLKHLPTSQWLASDTVKYVNDFGVENEVFGKSFLTTNKTQNLFAQKEGHKSATNALRSQGIQNEWRIIKG